MGERPLTTTPFDNTQALTEGWGIFECNSETPFQLQRFDEDEPQRFAQDHDAWKHVLKQACVFDSVYHRNALLFLADHSSDEFRLVMAWDGVTALGEDKNETQRMLRERIKR